MKAFIVLAVLSCFLLVSEARMNAFSCSGDCFEYDAGPYCMSNGYVACNNCVRDNIECTEGATWTSCSSACTDPTEIDAVTANQKR